MASNLYKIYVTSDNKWRELELDDLNLSTVFSVEEISDISQRKDNITKTITLKGTKQNNRVLGALYSIDRDVASDAVDPQNLMHNYKPNKYIDCFVLENNVEIIRGKLLVTSVDIVDGVIYYNASIVGTVYSFFSQLTDRKLEELDSFNIPKYQNLVYNANNIKASWKLPTLVGGINIINRRELTEGGVVWSDGEISTTQVYASYHSYTPFIKIIPNSDYVLRKSTNTESDKYIRLAFYDSGFNMLSRFTSNSVDTDFVVSAPANSTYVRLSFPTNVANIKMEEGGEFTGYSDNPEDKAEYVFPMIDYGGAWVDREEEQWDPNVKLYRWDVYRPAIYLKSYIDAIFRGWELKADGKGYTQLDSSSKPIQKYRWTGSIKSDEWFNKLIIPHNEAQLLGKIPETPSGEIPTILQSTSITGNQTNAGGRDSLGYMPISNLNFSTVNSDFASVGTRNINGKTYAFFTIKNEIKVDFKFKAVFRMISAINIPGLQSGGTVTVRLFRLPSSGATSFSSSNQVTEISVSAPKRNPDQYTWTEEANLTFSGNMIGTYVIGLEVLTNQVVDISSGNLLMKPQEEINNIELLYRDTYNLYDFIPKGIKVKDFLKDVMLMFNLFIIANSEDDTLFEVYTYDEFYEKVINLDIGSAIDWTDKVDWGSYSINSNIELSRGYKYSYKEDSDYYNSIYKDTHSEVYGEYTLLDRSGLIDTKENTYMFSPTINESYKLGMSYPAIYSTEIWGREDSEREQLKSNIRILYFSGEVALAGEGSNYQLIDQLGNVIPDSTAVFSSYGLASMQGYKVNVEDEVGRRGAVETTLFFGNPAQFWDGSGFISSNLFLYNKYHQTQIRELTDINLTTINLSIYLSEADINSLDFRNPIYLQSPYGSAYFKLLKVEYSNSNTKSTVTLQKIVLPDTNIKYKV